MKELGNKIDEGMVKYNELDKKILSSNSYFEKFLYLFSNFTIDYRKTKKYIKYKFDDRKKLCKSYYKRRYRN